MNTLFAGIGMQERGIRNTGLFDLYVVSISEIDKDAVVSYAAIHCGVNQKLISEYYDYPTIDEMKDFLTEINLGYVPESDKKYNWYKSGEKFDNNVKKYWLACKLTNNLGDITRIKSLPYADLWTISFPCQSISVAGRLNGLSQDSGTRSSLLWENIRLIKTAQEQNNLPKFLLLENVKNLAGKRFIKDFEAFNNIINGFGYNVYWDIINARDCGIPQNRERVFAIYIRNDIDNGLFTFQKAFDNGLRLKDVLEEHVDEKYYINTDGAQKLIDNLIEKGIIEGNTSNNKLKGLMMNYHKIDKEIDIASTVMARDYKGWGSSNETSTGILETN